MRAGVLTGASVLLTGLVLVNAWMQRQQFYPSVVYITKSNPSMAVIYLQSLVMVILMGKLMRKIFFGQLRAAEFEHLMERSWYAVTETCLAFTVFKDDFSPKFVALFTLLLFLKSFHWLAEDRVDYMERSPVITLLFHLRVLSLAVLLASLDMFFMQHAYTSTLTKGASVQLVFGFEYAILLTIVVNTLVKYVLHSIDLHSENPWENKAVFMLYTELFVGFVKVLLYVLFFVIMVRIYTLPLFAVRPMYLTMRAFKKAFNDVVLSRRAIHNMNTLYPDATAEELANTDNVCIICREEMVAGTAKKLPCGHIFHRNCLRSWFQRQQTCPTCRLDVLRAPASATQPQQQQQPQQPQPQQQQQQIFQQQMAALRNQLEAMQAQRNNQQQPAARQTPGQPQPPPQAPARGASGGPPAAGAGAGVGLQAQGVPNVFVTPPQAQAGPQPQTSSAPGGGGASRPPFIFPPFMPFAVPPPQPPPNFTGMSDQELRELEGTERNNVEARIRCLRNIQVLLDAAVMEMQQYSAVVARANITPPTAAASATTTTTTTQDITTTTPAPAPSSPPVSVSVAEAASTSSASNISSNNSSNNNPKLEDQAKSPSDPEPGEPMRSNSWIPETRTEVERPPSETGARPKTTDKAGLTLTEDQEEVRKRRLAVFEAQKKRLMSRNK